MNLTTTKQEVDRMDKDRLKYISDVASELTTHGAEAPTLNHKVRTLKPQSIPAGLVYSSLCNCLLL
jgi:hypothetical protein